MIAPDTAHLILEAAESLRGHYQDCHLCPWDCGVDRTKGGVGPCRTRAYASLSAYAVHHGEEPPISGTRGTGNLFFFGCPMSCAYCQNFQISQVSPLDERTTPEAIAGAILDLAGRGVHNTGLVSVSHVLPDVLMGMYHAAMKGVRLPVVYNTNSFEQVHVLRHLKGIVDIYLADLRYSDDAEARQYSRTRNYVGSARRAILEMADQVGPSLQRDHDGIAVKGLLVRLLVLPNDIAGIESSLHFLRQELGTGVTISIMAQYQPMYKAVDMPLISRRIYAGEYLRALNLAESMGFEDVYVQTMDAADNYVPDFRDGEVRFSGNPDYLSNSMTKGAEKGSDTRR